MSDSLSRKEMIRLLAMAGFSLYLPGCNGSEKPKASTALKPIEPVAAPDSISAIEASTKSQNVAFFKKGDADYEELRPGFNLRVSKFPLIIALCKNTEGVAEAIRLAKSTELKVAVKSGGHSFEGFSSIDEGMQLNLSLMKDIGWLSDEVVRLGPACLLREIYDELLPKSRLIPAGSCGTVGIAGLCLGGGYGFFSREHGLTCDSLISATVVDGNGEIHHAEGNDELMWMLRGGGNGNMAVATELVFKTKPAPTHFTRYRFKAYKLDEARCKQLLQDYFTLSAALPETCFAAFVLNYRTMVLLITDFGKGSPALQAMLDHFSQVADKADLGTPRNLASSLKNYYGIEYAIPFKNASAGYYQDYSAIAPAIDDILGLVFKKRGLIYQINTLGGRINAPEYAAQSCYPHRSLPYLSELQAYWEEGSDHGELLDRFSQIQDVMYSAGIRRQYRNYPSIGFKHWEEAYYGLEAYPKLQSLKAKYDPRDLFNHTQSVRLKPNPHHA